MSAVAQQAGRRGGLDRGRFASRGIALVGAAALAGAGGFALVGLGAAPATAAAGPEPAVSMSSPQSSSTVFATPTPKIAGTARPGDQDGAGVINNPVKVQISSKDGHPGATLSLQATESSNGSPVWSFSGAPSNALSWNGPYQLTVTVSETDYGSFNQSTTGSSTLVSDFALAVPPAQPRNLSAYLGSGSPSVVLSWSPNGEADLVGYEVQRSDGSGAWTTLATVTSTGYQDSAVNAGSSYSYQVIALRSGASAGQTVASTPSAPVSATVPPPPAPPSSSASSGGSKPLPPGSTPAHQVQVAAAPDPITALLGPDALAAPASAPPTTAAITGAPVYGPYSTDLPYPSTETRSSLVQAPEKVALAGSSSRPASPMSRQREIGAIALGALLLAFAAHMRRLTTWLGSLAPGGKARR